MQLNADCRANSECGSQCCASDLHFCVESYICDIKIATLKSFPVLEIIGAIGGLVFFIFLVVAICTKSKKNWDEVLQKNDITKTDADADSSFVEMSFHERERVIKIQEERKRRKTIILNQKKQRMMSIMKQKEQTDSFFRKKEMRAEQIKRDSFFYKEKNKGKKQVVTSKFSTKDTETEPKKKLSTKERMRQMMRERMAKAFTSKISENTQENQLESVDNNEMIKVPYQAYNIGNQRRISKSLRRYQLEQQLHLK